MVMKTPMITSATLIAVFAGLLPAADSQLVSLVMPDAKVIAGVNVEQAKGTPFGQYILTRMQTQNPHLQQIMTLTGFDPTRDLQELLFATNAAPGSHSGLALARGTFDASKIGTAAQAAGAVTESYKGLTLVEDPKHTHAFTFLMDGMYAIAGDVASVKGAIDRLMVAAPLPAQVIVGVNQWSNSEDAWALTTVPPSSLKPPAAPNPPNPALANAFQNVQQLAGGVKFGSAIVVTGQAQAGNAQDATNLAGAMQFLVNLAQTQVQQKNPQFAPILQSLMITASDSMVNFSLTVPEAMAEQAVQAHAQARSPALHHAPRHQ
jgi:hypothetical protein